VTVDLRLETWCTFEKTQRIIYWTCLFIQNQRMRIRNCICYDTHLRISSDTCVALLQLFLWNKERCTSSCSPKNSSNGSNVQRLSFRENWWRTGSPNPFWAASTTWLARSFALWTFTWILRRLGWPL
jgi:hypothetical protein